MHVVLEPHEGLETALLYVEKPAERREATAAEDSNRPIDVAELVEQTTIEALNQAAEAYFASLTNWDHQLTKPFSQAHEAPTLLMDMSILMQGLHLTAGTTVLDFGAGTGWFARFLTQLGCRVILLDVSATALKMARELYERQPIIGDRPAPVAGRERRSCVELSRVSPRPASDRDSRGAWPRAQAGRHRGLRGAGAPPLENAGLTVRDAQ
jgi:SAM-dependent methyltransferase